jgi:hypothetical protein
VNKKLLLYSIVFLVFSIVATEKIIKESFIVQPKPKRESRGTINEAIGTLILGNNKKCAQLTRLIANLQEFLIDQGDALLCQEKNSLFVSGEINDLQGYRARQQKLSDDLDTALHYYSKLNLNSISIVATEKINKESFIIQAKPKEESRGTINKAIGTLILGNNKKCAQLIKHIANLQESLINQGDALLCQAKNSLFVSGEINDLQSYRARQQKLSNDLDFALHYYSKLNLKSKRF